MSSSCPEFVAVVLAATTGARLFPMTSAETPKHLLPVAGVPVLLRLLQAVAASGFSYCIVALANGDSATMDIVKQEADPLSPNVYTFKDMQVTIVTLSDDCAGSAEALVEMDDVIPSNSHAVVLPGDLVVLDISVLTGLVNAHRQSNLSPTNIISTSCTMLLADVGEQDEHGVPLKESAKQKKGGLAREDEDIEYIALSYSSTLPPRVIWKQSKIDVEEDEDLVGQSPKLVLPKARLRNGGCIKVTTDWTDMHVYVLAPWLRTCLRERNLLSLQGDGIPLWVSRQFRGVAATFGSKAEERVIDQVMTTFSDEWGANVSTDEYAVRSHVVNGWKALRANSIPSYLYACREVVALAVDGNGTCASLPPNTTVNAKFNSIVLQDASLGEKVTCKASTVGRRSKISAKCRLNNVVVMDDVTVKDNCTLQNSILGAGCIIGENCSLNDCQVAPGKEVPPLTKEKGESLMDEL